MFYVAALQSNRTGATTMAKKQKKQTTRKAKKTKQKKQNLAGMDFNTLMNLRNQVDEALAGHRSTLERQLAALGGSLGSFGGRGGRGSSLKGTKVAAKYRGPEGETWAGRGATPRWLKEAIKGTGKKREDFLIDKSGAKAATKRRTKK
jgi:DNA-binding protein H-NS